MPEETRGVDKDYQRLRQQDSDRDGASRRLMLRKNRLLIEEPLVSNATNASDEVPQSKVIVMPHRVVLSKRRSITP